MTKVVFLNTAFSGPGLDRLDLDRSAQLYHTHFVNRTTHMVNLSLHIEITAPTSPDPSLERLAKITEFFLHNLIAYIAWLLGTLSGGGFYNPHGNTNRLNALTWPAYMAIMRLIPANPG